MKDPDSNIGYTPTRRQKLKFLPQSENGLV